MVILVKFILRFSIMKCCRCILSCLRRSNNVFDVDFQIETLINEIVSSKRVCVICSE